MILSIRPNMMMLLKPIKERLRCWKLTVSLCSEITTQMSWPSKTRKMKCSWLIHSEILSFTLFTRGHQDLTSKVRINSFFSELIVKTSTVLKSYSSFLSKHQQKSSRKIVGQATMMILMMTFCKFPFQKMTLRVPQYWFLTKTLLSKNWNLLWKWMISKSVS